MTEEPKPVVKLSLVSGYKFRATFPGTQSDGLLMDEPEPLGNLAGPNASRVLAASIGNCLSASLLFCLQKAKVEVTGIETEAEPTVQRNEEGRLRVSRVDVTINAKLREGSDGERVKRCIDIFENYCVVTAAVKKAIPVGVRVNVSS